MQTVDRALQALDLFSPLRPEISVADVARELDVDRSIASRLLAALETRRYVTQDRQTGRFRLGIRALELGALYLQHDRLVAAAVPHLEMLSLRTDGVANVFVLLDGEAIRLASYPARPMTGIRVPTHCTAAGKALLASLPEAEVEQLMAQHGMRPSTPNSATSLDALRESLEEVRRSGVASDIEERNLGRGCLAAPVRDVTGRTVAAVSASWRISQITEERRPVLVDAVRDAAFAISDGLGPGPLMTPWERQDEPGVNGSGSRREEAWNANMSVSAG
jgi:IclR family transcriptional regulator, KDG regulon repressor